MYFMITKVIVTLRLIFLSFYKSLHQQCFALQDCQCKLYLNKNFDIFFKIAVADLDMYCTITSINTTLTSILLSFILLSFSHDSQWKYYFKIKYPKLFVNHCTNNVLHSKIVSVSSTLIRILISFLNCCCDHDMYCNIASVRTTSIRILPCF